MAEAIFKARTAKSGKIVYANPDDVEGYCIQYPDMDVTVHIKPIVKDSEKIRLNAFWESVILPATTKALLDEGWDGITNAFSDKYLKNALAKKVKHNRITGAVDYELPEKKKMVKAELRDLVSGAIRLLESRHSVQVMDSQAYLENKKTGFTREFKKIK